MSIATSVRSGRAAGERYRMERSAVAENAARLAQSTSTLRTFGIGSIIIAEPLVFDTPFTHEPAVMSGYALAKAANDVYQLPLASVGVRQWVKKGDLFTAALVYVSVFTSELPDGLRPLKPAEYKSGREAYNAGQRLGLPNEYLRIIPELGMGDLSPTDKGILEAAWDEQSPGWLKDITVVHSITFSGVAIKDVSPAGVDDDPAATPRTSPLGQVVAE